MGFLEKLFFLFIILSSPFGVSASFAPMCEGNGLHQARKMRSSHNAETIRQPASVEFHHATHLNDFIEMEYLSGLSLRSEGPNCWNAALLSAGILKEPRYVTKPEFWFWMNSPYCRALGETEHPSQGDIGSLFWLDAGHFHSFVRLNDDFVFSKNSPSHEHRYAIQRYEDMFYPEFKEMGSRCKGSESDLVNQKCQIQVVYHRCRPLPSDFVSKYSELYEIDLDLGRAERDLAKWTGTRARNKQKLFEDVIFRVGEILDELREIKATEQLEFARQALEYRAIGLLLTDLGDIPDLSDEAKKISAKAYDIQEEESSLLPADASEVLR